MSKIFEVLHRSNPDVTGMFPEVAPGSVAREPAPPAGQPDKSHPEKSHPEKTPHLQNGGSEAADPGARSGGAETGNDEYRTASLRVSALDPVLPFQEDAKAGEQYRLLRTRIIQHPRQPKVIVVSSAGTGDGKSTTALNLAGVLSLKDDAKVLLLDADFRRPTAARQLGIDATPGLSDVLSGGCALSAAIMRAEQYPNLHVLTAGTPHANSGELLESPAWAALCLRLRSLFRYVVVDSPPISAVADYDLLAAAADGVIVVVRPDHTPKSLCFKALDAVGKDKFLGVVLNCVPEWFLGDKQSYDQYYGTPRKKKKP